MSLELVYEVEGKRSVFSLEKSEVTIGRSEGNDIVLPDSRVSRRHAKLFRRGTGWRIQDLQSSNGTIVNGVKTGECGLQDGDRIQIHTFMLTVQKRRLEPSFDLRDDTGIGEDALFPGTVVRSAIDFSTLAKIQSGVTEITEKPAANLDRLQKLLGVVTKASEALLSSASLDETLKIVLDLVFDHLRVDRGCIMLWNEQTGDLEVRCVRQSDGARDQIQFSRTIAEKVFRERVSVLTSDALSDERFSSGQSIIDLNIRSAMAAPMWNDERVDGLIYVDNLVRVKAFDNFDLDLLSALGNHAAVAIEQARLQASILEQQLVRERLGRYHSPAVIEHITASVGGESALVADEKDVTVMFADVVGFTDLCETMPARQIAELLNRYFSEMAEVVFRYDGTLDKFIGDCMMAVFGAPIKSEDHANRAASAALDMRDALDALTAPMDPEHRLRFRVGIHSGRVVAGDIGSIRRSDYTVLGATVNLAARLESSVAKAGQIIVSDTTNQLIGHAFRTRHCGNFQPKGISRDVACFELLGRELTESS